MNSSTAVVRPDTDDMIRVHQVFRDALGCSPQLVGSVCGDRSDRVGAVMSFYENILAFLHVHHEGEDELLWPKLLERAPEQSELIRRVAGQHEGVGDTLADADARLAAWREQPDIERGAALAAALATLGVELAAHLAEEERRILPIVADHLTVDEWAELPKHGMQNFRGDKLWLIVGLIQEQMPPAGVEHMNAAMPEPVRAFWLGEGRRQYEEFVGLVRG